MLAVPMAGFLPPSPAPEAIERPGESRGPFCIFIPWQCASSSGAGSLFGFPMLGLFQLPLFGASPFSPAPASATAVVRFGAHAVEAEVAYTPSQRARGLAFRTSLAPDAGMLFLFPAPTTTGFWMKDTLIPLSIAYLRETGDRTYSVVSLLDMEPCRADPCPTYPPGAPYDAALEVNQGWFVGRGIAPGAEAQVEGNLPGPL